MQQKKAWETPVLENLNSNETRSGDYNIPVEGATYGPSGPVFLPTLIPEP